MPNIDLGQVMGPTGAAAGFGTVSATVDGNTGTPAVTVTASGPDTAKQFAFAFSNLKGATGATGADGPNEVSTGTATSMIGVLTGNGSTVDTLNTGALSLAQIGQAIKDAAANPNSTGFAPNGYGLGNEYARALPSNSSNVPDYDLAIESGWYAGYTTAAHRPADRIFAVLVLSASPLAKAQIAFCYNTNEIYIRRWQTNSWSQWISATPRLELDTEYLTAEMYAGKPVYVKVVSKDSIAADTLTSVSVGTGGDMPVDLKFIMTDSSGSKYCTNYAQFLKYSRLVINSAGTITVQVQSTSALSYPSYFICKYTKT